MCTVIYKELPLEFLSHSSHRNLSYKLVAELNHYDDFKCNLLHMKYKLFDFELRQRLYLLLFFLFVSSPDSTLA